MELIPDFRIIKNMVYDIKKDKLSYLISSLCHILEHHNKIRIIICDEDDIKE